MSTAVILAAGRSSRSGRIHKGLRQLRRGEQSTGWLEYQIAQLRRAGFRRIKVVTGYRPRLLKTQIKALGATQSHNPLPARGPFSSLQQALKGFTGEHTLLVPLDNPVPTPGVLYKIRRAMKGNADKQVAKPCFQGRGGHPLILHKTLVQQLKTAASEGTNARLDRQLQQLPANKTARVRVKTPQVRLNLNTPQQWVRYQKTIQSIRA